MTRPVSVGLNLTSATATTVYTVPVGYFAKWSLMYLFNNSGSTLKVYPNSGAAIAVPGTGLGSANASYAHTTYAVVEYKKITSTQWLPKKSA